MRLWGHFQKVLTSVLFARGFFYFEQGCLATHQNLCCSVNFKFLQENRKFFFVFMCCFGCFLVFLDFFEFSGAPWGCGGNWHTWVALPLCTENFDRLDVPVEWNAGVPVNLQDFVVFFWDLDFSRCSSVWEVFFFRAKCYVSLEAVALKTIVGRVS